MAKLAFFGLLTANIISLVGSALTLIALPWFVLQTTGSASQMGLTGFVETLAVVLAGFLGGALVDRTGYKLVSIVADLTSGLGILLIPLLHNTLGLAFWQLLGLVFLAAFFNTPGNTARRALLPHLTEQVGFRLEQANAAYQGVERTSFLLGAPLAGLLIGLLGPANVLWLDAATFLISALLVSLSVPKIPSQATKTESYASQLKEGIRFIRQDRLIFAVVATVIFINLLDAPGFTVLLPVLANKVYGSPTALGLMVASFGAGSLTSIFLFGLFGHRLPRRPMFITLFILMGLPIWWLATMPSLPFAILAMLLRGLASGPVNPLFLTILQERIPPPLRGRVFGAVAASAQLAMPLGMLSGGFLVDSLGLGLTFLLIALAYLVVTLSLLFNPALAEMSRHLNHSLEKA